MKGIPFYRCILCGAVVSLWDIHGEPHACTKCGQTRIKPTNLSWWEAVKQMVKHPALWRWDEKYF